MFLPSIFFAMIGAAMVAASLNISSRVIASSLKVVNKVLRPYFYHENGNFASVIRHLSSLPVEIEKRGDGLSVTRISGLHKLCRFHLVWLSRLWLVFVSLVVSFLVSFLMRLLNGGAVLLGASKVGYCYQARQKGYLFNAPDVFYFSTSSTGLSTVAKTKSHEEYLSLTNLEAPNETS